LREQSKLTTVIRNLGKLSDALEKLSKSSGMLPFIERLETSLKGLASIPKMNSISNLTRSFNNAAPAARKLAEANEDLNDSWDKGSINLMATIQNYDALVNAINIVADAMASVLHQAVAWDGVQARFVRAMGTNAQMYYERIEKINEVMGINIQQFMSNSSLFADMMRGFGVKETDASTMAMGFTELAYDIWAGTNDVFSSLEEAMDAVRSTIGGETESIQRAGFSVIESTLQETAARHDLAVNIEKATMAEKTYLRYLTLVDQAHARGYVGVYAAEMRTAEGAIRSLSQSMKTLVQAFGSLFIPILEKVIPYITAFVEVITDAVRVVAGFFGIELFEIDWSKGGAMGGLADSAEDAKTGLGGAAKEAKKLKDYTMGFDELNVIDPDSGSSGGGAGGAGAGNGDWMSGLDLDTLWDESVFAKASTQVADLKQKIEDYIEEHKLLLSVVGTVTGFLGFMKVLRGLNSLLGITKTIDNLKNSFGKLKVAATSIKEFFQAAKVMSAEVGWLNALFPKTSSALSTASTWVTGTLVPAIKTALTKIPSVLATVLRVLPWVTVVTAIIGAITLAIVDYDFTDFGYKIGHALGSALKKVGEFLGAAGDWIVSVGTSFLNGINAAWEWVKEEFDVNSVFELIFLMFNPTAWVTKIIPKMLEIGAEVLPGLWEGIKNGWDNFWGNIGEMIDGFVQGFKDALGIASPSKVFIEIGEWIVQGLLDGVSDRWNAVKAWFEDTVAPKFTKQYWVDKYNAITSATKTKLEEAKKLMSEKWNTVTSWFSKNVAPKFTKDYWLNKFNSIAVATKNKMDEVKKLLGEKWSGITSWFDKNVSPKFTKEYWLGKFSGLKVGLVQTMKNAINSAVDILNSFIDWINGHLNFSWDGLTIAGKEIYPGGSVQLFSLPYIQKFEKGGFIEDGVFTMNRGEIAGKFNNGKSVVANNQQIVAGIAEGVYSAVVAAMSETQQGGQAVNVYLDGKQIYSSVKRTEARRGANLMGNQLGYVY
jgi:hypothetical protein